MRFTETPLAGAFVITPERLRDARGFFARTFCEREFRERGLNPDVAQCNISTTSDGARCAACTTRGLRTPRRSCVRCTRGAIYDVIIDLRPGSPTYLGHFADAAWTRTTVTMLYVPEGFAHGFLTLEDGTEVSYQMSADVRRRPRRGRPLERSGVRHPWPLSPYA